MRSTNKRRGWTFILAAFLLFALSGFLASRRDSDRVTSAAITTHVIHPIITLMEDAKIAYARLLSRQSKTLPDAVAEYKRRNGRDPPRGFDHWWTFAKENQFKLVDEFDAVDEDLKPFWGLSGEELRQRSYLMGRLPSIDIVRVQGGEVSILEIEKAYADEERGERSMGFARLLERFRDKLPDMDLPINTKAEARVLVPWEHAQYPNLTLQGPANDLSKVLNDFQPDWQGQGSVWEAYRRTCSPGSPARQLYSSYRSPSIQKLLAKRGESQDSDDHFEFVKTVSDDFDFCTYPWARYTQGHFFSDWRTISLLAPVFSPSKATGFADIRIPSHYYHARSPRYTYGYNPGSSISKEIDDMEVPWHDKSDLIFWRGSTTGGGSTPPGFTPNYHRHRFLRMAHESASQNVTVVHASPLRADVFINTTVQAKDLNTDIMDVAFVSAVGDYPGGEGELRKIHRFTKPVPLGKHWSYKYLIDLDGMSYSGRFMALMASDSAVLKSTVYKEYFSDWLQPWLHYIPVSSSYAEVYNIHAYFSGPSVSAMNAANATVQKIEDWDAIMKKRDTQLRQIARAGKQWKRTVGRKADMEVYVYRLCLEYARLLADDRDTMNFVL